MALSLSAFADEAGDQPAAEHGPPTELREIPVLTLPEHASDTAREHVALAHERRDAKRAEAFAKRQERIATARARREAGQAHRAEAGARSEQHKAAASERRAAAQARREAARENAATNKERAAERRAAGQSHRPAQ